MDRDALLAGTPEADVLAGLGALHRRLQAGFAAQFDRSLPFADELFDRWERARALGFGEGSSVYDSALVIGRVDVGRDVWVGPQAVLDGSGGLRIGDGCTVAAGAHLYTHDNVAQTLTAGAAPVERGPVAVGAHTYVGPLAVVGRGVTVGHHCVVGAGAFVRADVPDFSVVVGAPARVVSRVVVEGDRVRFEPVGDPQTGSPQAGREGTR